MKTRLSKLERIEHERLRQALRESEQTLSLLVRGLLNHTQLQVFDWMCLSSDLAMRDLPTEERYALYDSRQRQASLEQLRTWLEAHQWLIAKLQTFSIEENTK